MSCLDPKNFRQYFLAQVVVVQRAAEGETWITLQNGQHIMLDKENYTVVLYRDPKTGKKLDKPEVFKYKTVDDAQAHASRLLKTLKQSDFSLWAPAK
jgi:hypothetical protein